MKRKKNNEKTCITIGDKEIYVEDLIKEVNKYDKSFGLKLRKPDIFNDPYQLRHIFDAKSDMNIGAMMCAVNGIEVSDYFDIDINDNCFGMNPNPIGVEHPVFTDMSILNWDDESACYDVDSLMFRCRYITMVLSRSLGRMSDISSREADDKYRYKHSKDERRLIRTKEIINDFYLFTKLMCFPDESHQNIILRIHEHISYTKKRIDHKKLTRTLNTAVISLRKNMKKELLNGRFLEDDMAIHSILQIAYMMATNRTDVDVLPNFRYIEGATVKHDLSKLIEELGACICDRGKYSPMFKSFIDARPKVITQYYKECKDNYFLKVGILALANVSFVVDDYDVCLFIKEMMKKGM